jgi:hypothetical protein
MQARSLQSIVLLTVSGWLFYACGGTTPPAEQPQGDIIPIKDGPVSSATAPTPTTSAPEAAPSASAPEKRKPAPSSGSPMSVTGGEKEVTAPMGQRGGILRLGEIADLLVPRDAIPESIVFTFSLNVGKGMVKITPYKGQIGEVYKVKIFKESDTINAVSTSSASTPFIVKLPAPKGAKPNLAVLVITDGKAKFTVIAPKSIEEKDNGVTGVFELPSMPGEAFYHLTSAAPAN